MLEYRRSKLAGEHLSSLWMRLFTDMSEWGIMKEWGDNAQKTIEKLSCGE